MSRDDRTIVNIHETPFDAYDLEGPAQEDMSLLPISYDRETGRGVYVIRMEPGAVTIAHTHECLEEFLILEGELIESDGTVLGKGDFTSYRPGTHHNSRTETGCLLVGFDWDPPQPSQVDTDPSPSRSPFSQGRAFRGENPAGLRLRPQIGEVLRPVEAVALKGRRSVSGGTPRPRT